MALCKRLRVGSVNQTDGLDGLTEGGLGEDVLLAHAKKQKRKNFTKVAEDVLLTEDVRSLLLCWCCCSL